MIVILGEMLAAIDQFINISTQQLLTAMTNINAQIMLGYACLEIKKF